MNTDDIDTTRLIIVAFIVVVIVPMCAAMASNALWGRSPFAVRGFFSSSDSISPTGLRLALGILCPLVVTLLPVWGGVWAMFAIANNISHHKMMGMIGPVITEVRPALVRGSPAVASAPLTGPHLIVYLGGAGSSEFATSGSPRAIRRPALETVRTLILVEDEYLESARYVGRASPNLGQPAGGAALSRHAYHVWAIDLYTHSVAAYGRLEDRPLPSSYIGRRPPPYRLSTADLVKWADSLAAARN